MTPHSQAALILAGHGSTVNPDSSAPTHSHADRIRRMGVFREVVCCFWKEEPGMREVFESVDSAEVYVVPNFISEGYFCQQVLPRELGLDGPVTRREGKVVYYCDPVGVHPSMTRLLLRRADEVAPGVPRAETSLVVAGHGTSLNENSRKAIENQVRLIREGGHGFAEVVDAYMEEPPLVSDWAELTRAKHVVVVPFFIADGLHSFQDIPVLLGMESEPGKALSEMDVFRQNPIEMRGRKLYYSGAIGTEPLMTDVILDQVRDFDLRHGIADVNTEPPTGTGITAALESWLGEGRNVIGQLRITAAADGYDLRHVEDGEAVELRTCTEPEAAREWARLDAEGAFRPIKTAPNLRRGWRLLLPDVEAVRIALDCLYPAAPGMALAWQEGRLRPGPLRVLLGRQTGMYRYANSITDEQAGEIIGRCCETRTRCLRRIVFPMDDSQSLPGPAMQKLGGAAGRAPGVDEARAIPLLCMEACSHIVSAARKQARENHQKQEQGGGD
ncbi:MAG TPA: CbiX/SirB N-terminal domain-containing protein [Prosthecobacter sp.]|nr:CbiX/SirB N-terminal domain-containing protein [Prosthecobacter sp.]